MANENCFKRAKSFLLVFNAIMIIFGVLLVISGIWIYELSTAQADSRNEATAVLAKSVIAILIIGYSSLIIGTIGYRGSDESSKLFLGCYVLVLMTLLIVEVVLGLAVISSYSKTEESFRNSLQYYQDNTAQAQAITSTWITLQEIFNCCGIDGIDDWKLSGVKYPPPPCRVQNIQGCKKALEPYILSTRIAVIVICVLQLASVFLACYLFYASSRIATD